MGYLNPVEIRGPARYAAQAVAAGIDGALLVDLTPEEAADYRTAFETHGLDMILLAAPTTSPARMAHLCELATGYLYYVSYAGVTGADHLDAGAANDRLHAIRALDLVPVVAGFGIKDAASAAAMAGEADGVVVGSALVAAMADAADADDAARRAAAFLAPLRRAIDAATPV
jgi:tryptophan synthase alpha chain